MKTIKLVCWNVNGLRALGGSGLSKWLSESKAHAACLQETKISDEALTEELKKPKGYQSCFNCGTRPGYSGVAIYSKTKPLAVASSTGFPELDPEGRYLRADFEDFSLISLYVPNGKASAERLSYKMAFYEALLKHLKALRKEGRKLIICGDINTAHRPIDLAHPKANEKISGFLPEERAFLDRFLKQGYIDTFRYFHDEPDCYTWWSLRTAARKRNVGWRLDYFYVSDDLKDNLVDSEINSDVMGSDHCPISLRLKF